MSQHPVLYFNFCSLFRHPLRPIHVCLLTSVQILCFLLLIKQPLGDIQCSTWRAHSYYSEYQSLRVNRSGEGVGNWYSYHISRLRTLMTEVAKGCMHSHKYVRIIIVRLYIQIFESQSVFGYFTELLVSPWGCYKITTCDKHGIIYTLYMLFRWVYVSAVMLLYMSMQ